jgi:PKD repeat protein
MQKSLTTLSLAALALAACQKDPGPSSPAPVASFTFNGSGSEVEELTVATYNEVTLTDQSTKAVTYRYTLGNDSVRTTASPRFYYTKPGLYTVTLTVQGADKQTATATRRVRVLERVARQVVIQNLNDEVNSPQHKLVDGTYWVVVRLGENNVRYPQPLNGNPSFEAPILYQSPKVKLTQASLPYAFSLPTPLTINYPALQSYTLQNVTNKLGYAGVGYGLEIYEQDANGTVYLLTSSYLPYYRTQSGGISDYGTDFQNKILQVGYGGIYLKGVFE